MTVTDRIIILADREHPSYENIAWEKLGQVVTEISELYQVAREQRLDLILAGENRNDLNHGVAMKIRRFNGLTDIWRVSHYEMSPADGEAYIDGYISTGLGLEGISKKIKQILVDKELLAGYKIIGRSDKMKAVARTINRIAPADVAVLVVGPSGSGKELVAQAIHDASARHDQSYVTINCGALADGVLESELFGHERGAFTGSVAKREGLFFKAEGGTLFLDEIGETKPDTQVKLLRVLEDGTYYPVGSSTPRRADVRIVAATNRDLTEAIAEKQFREDLYFRISVVKIILPSLMERKYDIQPLLQYFWADHKKLDYTDAALELLMKYDWQGNIRQLRNFAARMSALKTSGLVDVRDVERFISEQHTVATHLPVSTGKTVEEAGHELIYRAILSLGNEIRNLRNLITAHLPSDVTTVESEHPESMMDETSSMEEMERKLIIKVLDETDGNRKEAARKLGIGERTLYRKLNKYNIS
jgi:DNA-binding NtrC family response regulator